MSSTVHGGGTSGLHAFMYAMKSGESSRCCLQAVAAFFVATVSLGPSCYILCNQPAMVCLIRARPTDADGGE